jgi:hypothetical protein
MCVLISADATQLWQAAATWGDVWVDTHGSWAAAGLPGKWSSWWVLDGLDNAEALRLLDRQAGLNAQVQEVQGMQEVRGGGITGFECFLTGDGKGMQAFHHQEGRKCWVCERTVAPLPNKGTGIKKGD